ncbi:MAG: transporter substrate-binding domain-containing protein [Eubacteriales bacterium]|nr:transporter substrate-binding domain-containing protein [Eubacteriales bacterium]
MTAVCVLMLAVPSFAYNNSDEKTVRVAYYEAEHFQEGAGDDSVKSGYAFEVLHEISNYTGWNYEYVYGDWAELYDSFTAGEIDLFAGLAKSWDRVPYMEWPDIALETDGHCVFVGRNDRDFDNDETHASLIGKRIGLVRDNIMTTEFTDWARNNEIAYEAVYYDDIDILVSELERGKIDAFVGNEKSVDSSHPVRSYVKIADTKSYIAVKKGRTDLLDGLNSAMALIERDKPDFYKDLKKKYFNTAVANTTLSAEEVNWLNSHSELRIGYIDKYLPYSSADEFGKPTGVITDIVPQMIAALKLGKRLDVKYVCYNSYNEMLEGLGRGEIDTAFPVMKSIWHADQFNMIETEALVHSSVSAVYSGGFGPDKLHTIAVLKDAVLQEVLIKEEYPESTIIRCESMNDCLEMVLKGEAGCALFNSTRTHDILNGRFSGLSEIGIGKTVGFTFAVKKGNVALYSLLNRAISLVDRDEFADTTFKYVDSYNDYSINDYVRDNAGNIILNGFIIFALVIYFFSELLKVANEAEEKQKKANLAKSDFLFSMSHDVRTPMNAIIGYTDLIKKNLDNEELVRNYIKKMETANSFLLSLLNNVLEMSKIENGDIIIDEKPWDIECFREEFISMFENEMNEKDISYEFINNVKHRNVMIDEAKIHEVFINIVSNAIKYTPNGGKIRITVNESPTEVKGFGEFTTIVEDTGIGMSEEFLPHLFEKFSRARTSTESRVSGTGLGMPIVKKLVDAMGGTIKAESRVGVGTRITVSFVQRYLEATEVVKTVNEECVSDPVDLNGKRVLLAEDNDLNAEIAIAILSEMGVKAERAADGIQCVDMLKKARHDYYDLVLMDIQMPNMNGLMATRIIRKLPNEIKAGIPIVAMTANAFEEDRNNAFDAGMNGFIAKPVDVSKLVSVLTEVLTGGSCVFRVA